MPLGLRATDASGTDMRFIALALLVASACTAPSQPASAPTPVASAPRTQTASPLTPPSSSPASVALSCRLPITWNVNTGQGYVRKAGFLRFPDRSVTEDPSAPVGSWFFDRAFSRWVPVLREAVSNDGLRYAYTTGSAFQNTAGSVHVVDIASGADRTIYSGNTVYRVVYFAPEGIYLTLQAPEGRSHGLWLQDP